MRLPYYGVILMSAAENDIAFMLKKRGARKGRLLVYQKRVDA
jgi:hypothetical protein